MVFVRVRLVVEGEVQKVGYRDFVQRVARSLGIKGFVENLRDGTVQIVCEAEKEVLDDFVKKISVKEDFIDVGRIRIVETSPAIGEFEYFDIKYGLPEEELGDRMVMAVNFAKETRKEIGEMRKDVKDVHTGIKDMHSDIKVMGTDIKEMKTDIKEMRTDVKQVSSGIEGMHSEIHEMRTDMNRNFDEMAKRYDSISIALNEAVNTMKVELLKTREELTRAVDNLSRLVQEFIKKRHKD